jgi:hypothetical protein
MENIEEVSFLGFRGEASLTIVIAMVRVIRAASRPELQPVRSARSTFWLPDHSYALTATFVRERVEHGERRRTQS